MDSKGAIIKANDPISRLITSKSTATWHKAVNITSYRNIFTNNKKNFERKSRSCGITSRKAQLPSDKGNQCIYKSSNHIRTIVA